MNESGRLATFLFWFMVLAGGAVLAPCLILPAWLEYQAALQLRAIRACQVGRQEAELIRLRRQREHLETDDAYVLRLARHELNLEIPGAQRIPVEPTPVPVREDATTAAPFVGEDTLVPELSALLDQALQRYPLIWMFVRPETRPPLLLIGGGLILTAVVLLGFPHRPPTPHVAADPRVGRPPTGTQPPTSRRSN